MEKKIAVEQGGYMILWIVATVCAFYIKGLCGFANTLVFTSILNYTKDNVLISPVELLLGYPSNLIIAIRERNHIDPALCAKVSSFLILGSVLGAIGLKNIDTEIIKIGFGLTIILVSISMLFEKKDTVSIFSNRLCSTLLILISGLLCGLFGVGALLGSFLGKTINDNSSFRANICMIFFIENTLRIIVYIYSGIISLHTFRMVLILFPFMLIGLFSGILSCKRLNSIVIKKAIIMMLFLSGVSLILINL